MINDYVWLADPLMMWIVVMPAILYALLMWTMNSDE